MIKNILILISLVGLASCSSPYLSVGNMGNVNKGDSYNKYEDSEGTFDVDVLGDYKIDDMSNGGDYRILLYEQQAYFNDYYFLFLTLTEYTYVAMAFENDKLVFVGYPEDYLKADDKIINELGMKLKTLIEENL
jgi:hypothetical protein